MFTWDQNCQTDSLTVALNLEALAWRKRQFSRSLPLSLFHLGGSQSTPSTPDGCVLCEHPGSQLVGGLVGPFWFCWCCVAGSGCFGCVRPAPSPGKPLLAASTICDVGVESLDWRGEKAPPSLPSSSVTSPHVLSRRKSKYAHRVTATPRVVHFSPPLLSHHSMSYFSFNPLLSTGKETPRGFRLLF